MNQNLTHIKDVAKLLGVTRAMVYKRLAALNKKPTKVGGKSYIDGETLKEIQEGKRVSPKVSPEVSGGDNTASKEVVNLLIQQVEELKNDKVTLQEQISIKDSQIADLATGSRELRMLLGSAQKQIVGLLPSPSPVDEPLRPDYEPSTPAPKQPEMKPEKKKKKKKKKS